MSIANPLFPTTLTPEESLPTQRARALKIAWTLTHAMLLLVVLAAYAIALHTFYAPAITHPDSNGYWAQGTLLMETGRTWFKPDSNAQYVGMHWLLAPGDKFISRYPPGLAVVVGVVWKLFGWEATLLINPALAVLTLLGIYLIVARIASPGWGLAAVVLLAINAPFTIHALTAISHMPVAFCLVWGIYFLLLWSSSGKMPFALLAGLILGCIPTIRYADSVVALGIIVFLLWNVRKFPRIWRHYLAAGIGAAIPILPLLIRNQLVLGAFWRTGYSLTNEQTGFGWNYFNQNAMNYLQALQGTGLGMMFGLGLIGLVWMICTKRTRATGLMLLLSSTPLLLLYMAYYWARGVNGGGPGGGGGAGPGGGAGAGLRFLVPFVPLYIIAGAWALAEALRSANLGAKIAVPIVLIAMQATLYGSPLVQELRRDHDRAVPLVLATRELEHTTQKGDVVLASMNVLQHLDFLREWKLADPSIVGPLGGPGMRMMAGGGPGGFAGPDSPSPMQVEKNEARAKLYPQQGIEEKQRQFMTDVRTWAGDHAIYAIGNENDIDRLLPMVSRNHRTIVKRISTPKPSPELEPQNRGPGMGQGPGMGPGPRGGFGAFFGRGQRDGGGGGPFGPGLAAGEDIVIVKWDGK